MKSTAAAVSMALCIGLPACTALSTPGCAPAEQSAVQDSLYLGTIHAGGVVSPAEWSAFLESVVTPRFPQGLTVSQASGQWRGADGVIAREATYILHILHGGDAASEASVAAIAAAYKARFRQEAVLRVRARACTSF